MDNKLKKAKQILEKYFHFTQSQVDESKKSGLEVMNKEDIKYLMSLKLDLKYLIFKISFPVFKV